MHTLLLPFPFPTDESRVCFARLQECSGKVGRLLVEAEGLLSSFIRLKTPLKATAYTVLSIYAASSKGVALPVTHCSPFFAYRTHRY